MHYVECKLAVVIAGYIHSHLIRHVERRESNSTEGLLHQDLSNGIVGYSHD